MDEQRVVWTIHALNFVDAVATLAWLTQGVEEVNPVMDLFYQASPGLFVVGKLILIAAGVEVIRRLTQPRARGVLLAGVLALLASVVAWQLAGALVLSFEP